MPVEQVNLELPISKRIDTEDCTLWERFGIKTSPVMDKLEFSGYPFMYLHGIKINHFLSKDQTRAFLDGFHEHDKI